MGWGGGWEEAPACRDCSVTSDDLSTAEQYSHLFLVESIGRTTKPRFLEFHTASPHGRRRHRSAQAGWCRLQVPVRLRPREMPGGAPTGDRARGAAQPGSCWRDGGFRLAALGLERVRLCDTSSGGGRPGPAFERNEVDLPGLSARWSRAQLREGPGFSPAEAPWKASWGKTTPRPTDTPGPTTSTSPSRTPR